MASGEQAPAEGNDWSADVANQIESVVLGVRDKTVRPLTLLSRGLVFGVLVGIMVQVALAFLAVGIVRLMDIYAFPGRIWATYSVVGGIFVLLGWFLWTKRRAKAKG